MQMNTQSQPTHDRLNRRQRMRANSTGKRVTPQPRDLLWMQKIHEHGPLSSAFLHAYSRQLCRNEKRARDRLTDLFNEDHTPHGGAYLARPWQQFATFDARYQQLVYELAPAAELTLKQQGLWQEKAGGASGPWKHRYMVAAITASIELAVKERDDIAYIPQHEILDRADANLRYPVPFENPATRKYETRDLIPDALFGLEYRQGSEKSYRFFVVEADRGTEPTRTSRFDRKSHLRTLLQYREYVGRGLYKDHLNLTAGLLVLNVVTSKATMNGMLRLTGEISPKGNSYQLFQVAEGFGTTFRPTEPLEKLILEPWRRARTEELSLADGWSAS